MENENKPSNFIVETVKHIDKIQKEIVVSTATSCITCETSLVTQANNTIPVSFYLCNGEALETIIGPGLGSTQFYRIECLRDHRFATLRLITLQCETLTCTSQTCILDLDCVCAIQCFSPINCEEC